MFNKHVGKRPRFVRGMIAVIATCALLVGCSQNNTDSNAASKGTEAPKPTGALQTFFRPDLFNGFQDTCNRQENAGVLVTFEGGGTPYQFENIITELKRLNMMAAFFPDTEWTKIYSSYLVRFTMMPQDSEFIVGFSVSDSGMPLDELLKTDEEKFYGDIYVPEQYTNTKPVLMRTKFVNDVSMRNDVRKILDEKNIQSCSWNFDTKDLDEGVTIDQILERARFGDAETRALNAYSVIRIHMQNPKAPQLLEALAKFMNDNNIPYEKLHK